jgi:hypothetical protein
MRTRLIHPDFFIDPTLAALSDFTRLVFVGLWVLADREGRLVDSVKVIDGLILPLDERSCAPALEDLAAAKRILRYTTARGPVIQIVHFLRYQKPHLREKPSALPAAGNGAALEAASGHALGATTGTALGMPITGLSPEISGLSRAVSVSVSVSDPVSVSISDPVSNTRAAREESAPKARASDPRGGVQQEPRRRVAADGRAKRAASAPVDEALLTKHFGTRRR